MLSSDPIRAGWLNIQYCIESALRLCNPDPICFSSDPIRAGWLNFKYLIDSALKLCNPDPRATDLQLIVTYLLYEPLTLT